MTFSSITWRWDGWAGGPGFTVFRMSGNLDNTQTDAAAAAQRTFWAAHVAYLPSVVTLTCDTVVKVFADADGSLVEQRTIATPPAVVNGVGSGAWSAVAGACIVWRTGQSTGRRILMGRSFLVPLAQAAWGTNGQLSPAFLTASTNAAGAYTARVGAGVPGHPVVWHRPKPGAAGFSADVTAVTVNKTGAEIRRRRD
jgi:hypothetical protein